MFVRIGLVVAGLALLALLVVGVGLSAGFVRITEHGIALGRDDAPADSPANSSNVVSADELLKQKGVAYVDPQQTAPQVPQPAAPVVATQPASPAPLAPAVSQQPANAPTDGIIRIAAASDKPLTDPNGHVWEAASGFSDGEIAHRGDVKIDNTTFPALYQNERWKLTAWQREVPSGKYIVNLYFAETWDGISKPGQRLFSVGVQDQWIKGVDIFAQAGGLHRELVKKTHVNVTDGMLTIRFRPHVLEPLLNGIEIIPDGPADSRSARTGKEKRLGGTIRIAAGSAADFADAEGRVWGADSGFVGGEIASRGPIRISDTEIPEVYRNERYGMSAWHRKLANGNYTVKLHFAETSPSVQGPGQRVFHVIVQDQPFRDLDVCKESGGKFHALVKTCHVAVTESKLSIEFQNTGSNVAEINGIEVIRER